MTKLHDSKFVDVVGQDNIHLTVGDAVRACNRKILEETAWDYSITHQSSLDFERVSPKSVVLMFLVVNLNALTGNNIRSIYVHM